jgi:hypothetical protein
MSDPEVIPSADDKSNECNGDATGIAHEEQYPDEVAPVANATETRERRKIFLDPRQLPQPREEYVCWLDVMGARTTMARSLFKSTNNIGRLHIAILMNRNRNRELQTSPFMDGAYIRSQNQAPMLEFLWGVFEDLAFEFLKAREHRHRFMPRCGLSFGSIIQGVNIPTSVSKILGARSNTVYREGIYFGYPMVQAYMAESSAPPFGVSIDESARSFAPHQHRPLSGSWWRWQRYRPVEFIDDFMIKLRSYFDWCEMHTYSTGYPSERIRVHRAMAEEYFDAQE